MWSSEVTQTEPRTSLGPGLVVRQFAQYPTFSNGAMSRHVP
jgi:hypothetical protein